MVSLFQFMRGTGLKIRMARHKLHESPMNNWQILFLICLSSFLNLYAVNWGLPNVDDWASLSLAPLKPLSYAKHLFYHETWLYHYPPFHFMVLAVVFAPYVFYLLMTGGLGVPIDTYPYGLTNPLQSLTILIVLARCVSAAMGVGIVVVNYYAVKKFYGRTAAFWAGFLIATSSPIIHYSHIANVDVPQLFWFSLAFYAFISLINNPMMKYYIMLGTFTSFAFTTKESIYAIFVGVAVLILVMHFSEEFKSSESITTSLKSILDRKILYGLIAFSVVTLLIFNPFTNWEGFLFHVDRHSLRSVRGSWVIRDAPSKLLGHLELVGHYLVYMSQSNGLFIFLLVLGGFVYNIFRMPKKSLFLVIPIITYYIFFLRIHGTHHLRYMLPAYILLIWFAAKLCADVWNSPTKLRLISWPILSIVLAYSLIHGFSGNMVYATDVRYSMEEWMDKNIEENSIILAVEPDYSLPRLPTKVTVLTRELWDFHGNLIDDIQDLRADYIIVGMSIPRRHEQREHINKFFQDEGYQKIKEFATKLPLWSSKIPNLHALYPDVMVLKNISQE